MFHDFSGESICDVWEKVCGDLRSPNSSWQHSEGRGGRTHELLHVSFSIADPRQRWLQNRLKPLNIALAIAEVVWIMNGRSDAAFLKAFFPSLSEYTGNSSDLPGAYGYRLRRHFSIGDQLRCAYRSLRANPGSRQVVLNIWDPSRDFPNPDGSPSSSDVPCNLLSALKVRSGRLEWLQVMRSNDLQRGFPNNVVQFTMLQEIIAGWIGVDVGSYNHVSDSLHVYARDLPATGVDATSEIFENSDRLRLSFEDSEKVFSLISEVVDCARDADMGVDSIIGLSENAEIPEAYLNLLVILLAEILRRRRRLAEAQVVAFQCRNDALLNMWRRWMWREHPGWMRKNWIGKSCYLGFRKDK